MNHLRVSNTAVDLLIADRGGCNVGRKTLALDLRDARRRIAELEKDAERAGLLEWLWQSDAFTVSLPMAGYRESNGTVTIDFGYKQVRGATLMEALRSAKEREADRG